MIFTRATCRLKRSWLIAAFIVICGLCTTGHRVSAQENERKSDIAVPVHYVELLPPPPVCFELQIPEQIRAEIERELNAECPKVIVAFHPPAPDSNKPLALKIVGKVDVSSLTGHDDLPPARSMFQILLQGSDESSMHALGCVLSKNSVSGKGSLVRLKVQLNYRESKDGNGAVIEGTALWSYPHIGNWNYITGAKLEVISPDLEKQLRP